jgi:hypothetical protein
MGQAQLELHHANLSPPRDFHQVGSKKTGRWHASPEQTLELQGFAVERALRWIIARKPDSRIVAMRPRIIDAEAYKTEQEGWSSWNDMHLESEAEFSPPRTVSWSRDDPGRRSGA